MQCLILAGGLGTRMYPRTEKIPKVLLPVAGEPFLHHQLSHMRSTGVDSVVLAIGHLGQQVREYAGDGSRWGLKIRYSDEGGARRGTGGAIRLAAESGLLEERFLLTYGDSYLPVDFSSVYRDFESSGLPIAMCVYRNRNSWDRSNVIYRQGRVELYEKGTVNPEMEYIDYGLFGLELQLAEKELNLSESFDFSDFIHGISVEGRVFGIEMGQRFYEIGSPGGLEDLEKYLKQRKKS